MKRSTGVTVIAILSLLGSAFTFVVGTVMLVVMAIAPVPRSNEFPGSPMLLRAILLASSLMYLLPAVWGILTGIGLLRLKNWARISIIVFSVLLILMSAFTGLVSLVVPIPATSNNEVDPLVMIGIRMVVGAFWLALLGIGIWWLVFFNRSKVKEQFGQLALAFPGGSMSQTAYPVQSMPVSATEPGTAKRPLSITILAWLLLAGCAFIPLSLVLRAPAILFTTLLNGGPAILFFLTFAALQLCIGIGLLRLRPVARMAAVIYFIFGFLNSAVFYFAPGGHARTLALMESQQTMFPWMRQFQGQAGLQFNPAPFLVVGAVVGLFVITVPLYFLITRKLAFEMAAADLESRGAR
jgi:hypothetical protein